MLEVSSGVGQPKINRGDLRLSMLFTYPYGNSASLGDISIDDGRSLIVAN